MASELTDFMDFSFVRIEIFDGSLRKQHPPPLWACTAQNKCCNLIIIYTTIKSGLQLN